MRRIRRRATALLATTTLALAGCGGIGTAEDDDDTVRIGAVLSLTGSFAPSAKYVQEGYEYWADEVNANGGIDGMDVELVIRDDQSDPATAATLARSLVDQEQVTAILGPYGSGSTDTMAATLESLQVPMLGTIASDAAIWDRRELNWTFQAFPSSTYDHEPFLAIAEEQGYERITIINEEAGFSIAAAEWAIEQAEEMGMTVQSLSYPTGSQDFSSIVAKMESFDPQAVSMGGYYEPSIVLTNEMISQGFSVPAYHFIQAADGVTAEALGNDVEGVLGRSSWEPQLQTPGNDEFTSGYQEMFDREPSYHSAAAYAAGQVLQEAMTEAGTGAEEIRDFFASEQVETIAGTYEVNDAGQQVGFEYVGTQWRGDGKEIVWPDEEKTADVVAPMPGWS